ncbi:hypothetical protein AURDEDRAFT_175854 [Auricularia subglabra TFB-10046 SS5]|nr:hypothetical protein AURDEDRAFT_175854 [Auricularia subglabra TFB-10046 SS5]
MKRKSSNASLKPAREKFKAFCKKLKHTKSSSLPASSLANAGPEQVDTSNEGSHAGPTEAAGDEDAAMDAREAEASSRPEVAMLIDAAEQAHSAAGHLGRKTGMAAEHGPTAVQVVDSTLKALDDVVRALGKIQPYLSPLSTVLTNIAKPIIKQDSRDTAFEELLKEMKFTYELVERELHPTSDTQAGSADYESKHVREIELYSEKCSMFIQNEYLPHRNFLLRAANNTFRGRDVDNKVQEFRSGFVRLRERWSQDKIKFLEANTYLNRLEHIRGAGFNSAKKCLPGTRAEVLRRLSAWISDPEAPRTLFLIGVAGSGKTAIAHAIVSQMQASLGAFFAFDRSEQDRSSRRVLSTIAYELALWHEGYRHKLLEQLRMDPKLGSSTDIDQHWTALIVGPAKALASKSPILLVVDAFDECPDPPEDESRRLLLKYLLSSADHLPKNIRLLVTSRAVSDIISVVSRDGRLDLADYAADDDILRYVRGELPVPDEGGLNDTECEELARAADGLFQWAATACRYLLQRRAGSTMHQRFVDQLMSRPHGNISVSN